jgi:uncharacterized protein (TIGR02996 family)
MSDEDALLAAIAAHPGEDTPRLAYADWLDEHDRHTRAEFIRLQIEIERKQATLTRRELDRHVDLFKRQQELIDNHRRELLGSLGPLWAARSIHLEFRRGFVSELRLDCGDFGGSRATLAQARPLPRMVVADVPFAVREFLGFDVRAPRRNSGAHFVSAVRTIGSGIDGEDMPHPEALTDPQTWPRLDELDISGCRLGDVNIMPALRHFWFPALTDLDLSANDVTDDGVGSFLSTRLQFQLKRLILGGNPITDAGARLLVEQWPTGADDRLEHLNLRFTNIGTPGHQALIARFGGRVVLF